MKLIIDIPTEFVSEFKTDKFNGFFGRISADLGRHVVGNYELETLKMLQIALENGVEPTTNISRDDFTEMWGLKFNNDESDTILDMLECGNNTESFILRYHNQTAIIYDTVNDYYVSWYKITHLGRAIQTNIHDISTLDVMLQELKEEIFEM